MVVCELRVRNSRTYTSVSLESLSMICKLNQFANLISLDQSSNLCVTQVCFYQVNYINLTSPHHNLSADFKLIFQFVKDINNTYFIIILSSNVFEELHMERYVEMIERLFCSMYRFSLFTVAINSLYLL